MPPRCFYTLKLDLLLRHLNTPKGDTMSEDSKKIPCGAAYLALMALCVSISAQTASEVFSATGITAGLCVQLGTGAGTTTCSLDNGGKFVVHGLSVDNTSLLATRAAIASSGKQGLILAEQPISLSPLPYPDNFVNLLVGDLDALGTKAPPQSELERVLAPLGASYLKVSGAWKKYVKPMPGGMAEWRHWAGNGDGNNLSQDELVEPPTNVRWWAGHRNRVGKHTNNGFRLHQGIAVYEFYPGKIGSKSQPHALYGRDAFSGVLLWRQPGNNVYFGNDAYRSIVAGGGSIHNRPIRKCDPGQSTDGGLRYQNWCESQRVYQQSWHGGIVERLHNTYVYRLVELPRTDVCCLRQWFTDPDS